MVLAVAAGLNGVRLLHLRRTNPAADAPLAAPGEASKAPVLRPALQLNISGDLPARVGRWMAGHPLEVFLLGVLGVLSIYIWVVSPGTFMDRPHESWLPGHPYRALHFVRELQLQTADDLDLGIGVAGGLLSLVCFAFSVWKENIAAARVGLLIGGLSILCLWQLSMLEAYPLEPAAPFLLGTLVILGWGLDYRGRATKDLFGPLPSPTWEIALFAAALAVTILARVSFLDLQPYGIEGDELKWTVEVVRSMVDGQFVEATEYHLASVPVSFYMEALFLRLFGPGIPSARLATVVYSIVASIAFYALARRLAGPRVAWLATFLLGISLLDVSASRLANVESLVKLWPIAGLLALTWALDSRRTVGFVIAGALVGLGLLTYDTVAPLLIVGFIVLFYDLHRLKIPRRDSIRSVAAYVAPQLLVLPVAATYWIGRLQYYDLGNKGLDQGLLKTLALDAQSLAHALFTRAVPDFLYNRDGPLFESLLSPWLIGGVLLGVVLWRRARLFWVLVFAAFFFLPVPIVAQSAMGRVLYPGLPAAYFFMAISMAAVYSELRRLLGDDARPLLITLAAIGLVQLAVLHQYISFNEIEDPSDRQIRREILDIAGEVQASGALGIFPYMPAADDPIQAEELYAIWLGMRGRVRQPSDMQSPLVIPAPSLLPTLSGLTPPRKGFAIVWDISWTVEREARDALLAAFLRCYPRAERMAGDFFDRYFLSPAALTAPACGSSEVAVRLEAGSPGASGQVAFEWSAMGAAPRGVVLTCGRQSPAVLPIQAESMTGPGWETLNLFASDFQGKGFLADTGGSEAATLELSLTSPGPYYIWVRTYRRVEDPYAALLSVNGQTSTFGVGYEGQPTWIWERLGPFTIDTPTAVISIARPYDGPSDKFMALFFDTLVVTSLPSFTPETDEAIEIVLDKTVTLEAAAHDGSVTAQLSPGYYECWITLTDGNWLISASGEIGVRSAPVQFQVRGEDP